MIAHVERRVTRRGLRLERQLCCLRYRHLVMRNGGSGSLPHALVVCSVELLLHVVSVGRGVMCGKGSKGLLAQVVVVVRRRCRPGVALIARISLSLVGVKTVVGAEACLGGVGRVASSIRHNLQHLFVQGNDDRGLPKRSMYVLGWQVLLWLAFWGSCRAPMTTRGVRRWTDVCSRL